jgi:hypothetical protein
MVETVKTKNYGVAEIIGEGSKYGYYKVRFRDTNHIDEFRKDAIIKGEIRDKWAVSLCGVGVIGDIKTRGKYKQYYTLWHNMITRCYNHSNKAYDNVSVCDRWLIFQYFYEDIPLIDGWNKEQFEKGLIVLDKDIKQRNQKHKVYSPQTCSWVSAHQNSVIQDNQQKWFTATSPSGEQYIDYNITDFARKHNLERRQISAVLHNRFKSTLGWHFEYIDKEIV